MSKKEEYYKQVLLLVKDKGKSVCWIPEEHAVKLKELVIMKKETPPIKVTVLEVYSDIRLTIEQIDMINRTKFPSTNK